MLYLSVCANKVSDIQSFIVAKSVLTNVMGIMSTIPVPSAAQNEHNYAETSQIKGLDEFLDGVRPLLDNEGSSDFSSVIPCFLCKQSFINYSITQDHYITQDYLV